MLLVYLTSKIQIHPVILGQCLYQRFACLLLKLGVFLSTATLDWGDGHKDILHLPGPVKCPLGPV